VRFDVQISYALEKRKTRTLRARFEMPFDEDELSELADFVSSIPCLRKEEVEKVVAALKSFAELGVAQVKLSLTVVCRGEEA